MRILYVTTDLSCNDGWSVYGSNNANEAVKNGHEVHVCVRQGERSDSKQYTMHPILLNQDRVMWNPLRIFRQWVQLRTIIKRIQPDIIHVVVEPYIQLFALPLPRTGAVILTVHGTYAALPELQLSKIKRFISRFFFRQALHRVNAVVCVSDFTKKRFLKYNSKFDASKVSVIHSSIQVPVNQVTPDGNVEGSGAFRVVTVGAVKRRKGIHEAINLISNWAEVRKKKVEYSVIGSLSSTPWYVEEVQTLAQTKKSEYFHVNFLGHIGEAEKALILKRASLYVHLERVIENTLEAEGLGIGTIEAGYCGVPALVAKGSATAEAVRDGVSGYIVDLDDVASVYQALDKILLAQALATRDIQEFASTFLPEICFRKMEALYKTLR